MNKLKVYDCKGSEVGTLDVPAELIELKKGSQAVHDVVVAARRASRAGTASTLEKGEVAGSGKKPWRQKGTGRARAGYRQSPVWRGGGTVFGPKPRVYGAKVNKKVQKLAFRRAFSEKLSAGAVKVVDSLELDSPRTKAFMAVMKSLSVEGPVLILVDQVERNLSLASRNLPNVEVQTAGSVGVYEILRYPVVVATQAAMEKIKARLGGGAA